MGIWRTSSFSSAQGGSCVEVADTPGGILVRDTKQEHLGHARTVLAFTPESWTKLTSEIKAS